MSTGRADVWCRPGPWATRQAVSPDRTRQAVSPDRTRQAVSPDSL